MNSLVAIAVIVNSALYLSGCFIASFLTRGVRGWKLALASAGIIVLCYQAQLPPMNALPARVWSGLSIALGFAAGTALLVGY